MTGLLKRVIDAISPPTPMTREQEQQLKRLLSRVPVKAKVDVVRRRVYVRPDNLDDVRNKCAEFGSETLTDEIDRLRANPNEYFIFQG